MAADQYVTVAIPSMLRLIAGGLSMLAAMAAIQVTLGHADVRHEHAHVQRGIESLCMC